METDGDPKIIKHFKGHKEAITAVAFKPHGCHFVSSSTDKTIIVWNMQNSDRAFKFHGHKDEILDTCYCPSGELIATASKDKSVRLWVPTIKGESLDFKTHTGAVRSVRFSPDGLNVIYSCNNYCKGEMV